MRFVTSSLLALALVSCGSAQPAFAKDLTYDETFAKVVDLCRKDKYEELHGNKGYLRTKVVNLKPEEARIIENYCRFYMKGFNDGAWITIEMLTPKEKK